MSATRWLSALLLVTLILSSAPVVSAAPAAAPVLQEPAAAGSTSYLLVVTPPKVSLSATAGALQAPGHVNMEHARYYSMIQARLEAWQKQGAIAGFSAEPAAYAFVVAVFVYKDMGLKDVPNVLLSSASMSAMLLYIITNAVLFSFLMTHENIPQAMAAWITGTGLGWIGFLLVVNVLLLLAGNVMEPSSIVLIMAPILFPVAVKLGIDPIHFGILMVVNMEVGMCHPPVGLNLYVASGIARMGITELTIAVWPWLLTMLIFLGLVTYVPELSLWLPRVLGML